MAKRIAVVVSQGQSQNPAKRQLEEDLVTRLMFEVGVDVTVIPHLYDLKADGTGMLALQGIKGDLVVCSWLFERAARWVLDRNDVRGTIGNTLLISDEDDEEEEEELAAQAGKEKPRVVDSRPIPARRIWCLDLKTRPTADPFIEEVKRISQESSVKTVDLMGWIKGAPSPEALDRFTQEESRPLVGESPATEAIESNSTRGGSALETEAAVEGQESPPSVTRIEEEGDQRRWYPVIDYSRCTNCMECIDFCLFGVYGVDKIETILVEQPDNCRKGCPACSRVCPENAIMFPQHKNTAIAGADALAANLKIDLSKLFGAPETGKSAVDLAVLERDEQLLAVGRNPVGLEVGVRTGNPSADEPRDELDDLLDELDGATL
jgi:Pyruvate/2-oxoacid:ferredoxin oxidoreductase delta subunit